MNNEYRKVCLGLENYLKRGDEKMIEFQEGDMDCARYSIEKGILYLDFNGDSLCKECFDYCSNKLKGVGLQ